MMRIGLTGGIGSGKSTVANMFRDLAVPVYDSDERAKVLMNQSETLRKDITVLFGESAYVNNGLNRPWIAQQVFGNVALLEQLNGLVHPAVREDFILWSEAQTTPYIIQETALIFENNMEAYYDGIILVTAPKTIREERVMARDGVTREKVQQRMAHQLEDEIKRGKSQFIIENTTLEDTLKQVRKIHKELLLLSDSGQF
ncbi:MAG: dephospho-CoA kinase [Bacteroidota bacterium]